jgi:hypothetical protein
VLFTRRETVAQYTPKPVPRPTVTERLRQRLRALLRERGTATRLVAYSHGTSAISQQAISYFLNNTPGRRGIQLDDLDDLSGFFRVSIGELLGVAKPSELSGDEQRIIQAFRVLVPSMQEHVVMLVEQLSLAPRVERQRLTLHPSEGADITHAPLPTLMATAARAEVQHASGVAPVLSGDRRHAIDLAHVLTIQDVLHRALVGGAEAVTGDGVPVADEPRSSGARHR